MEMYEYRQIIYRLMSGQTMRSIAKDGIASRSKIAEVRLIAMEKGWLAPEASLPDEETLAQVFAKEPPAQQTSLVAPYESLITQWVTQGVNAVVIHQHLIHNHSFAGAYNSVQRFAKKLKDKQGTQLTSPLIFQPGEAAQVDFGKGPRLYDKRLGKEVDTWFFVMTLCWSRHQYVELIAHQDIETWLNCHQNAFNWFGGVVKKVIIDNPKCAITKACYHDPQVQRSYEAFALDYGFIISACPPREPKKKGRVEAGVKYVKSNFLPLRAFRSLQDANQQLKAWILNTAGNRTHGSIFEKPLTRFTDIERNLLQALPATQPEVAVWKKVSLYKDCHVRYLKCCYSAPHTLYDEEIWMKITTTITRIYHDNQLVATHPRLFKPGEYSTKLEHMPPNAQFYLTHDPNWCLKQAEKIGENCLFIIENLLTDPVLDLLRQAQSIINLSKTYGDARLELASQRALKFNSPKFATIKTILKEGLDYEQLLDDTTFDQLSEVYQGHGTFQRRANELKH